VIISWLLRGRSHRIELDQSLYALDSTTIDLCLSVFPWARFRKHKGAVKMHTLLDLHGNIPTFIRITDGKVHDVNILDDILPETDSAHPGCRFHLAALSGQYGVGCRSRSSRHLSHCLLSFSECV
jgi:hypothetical protein